MIILKKILGLLCISSSEKLIHKLIRSAVGSFGLKLLNISINLAISVLLARTLGAEGFGTHAYVVALLTLLTIPATLGFDRLLVREISIYRASKRHQYIKGILFWSFKITLIISIILGICTGLIFWIFPTIRISNSLNETYLLLAFCILPLISLNSLREAALKGFNDIVLGQISGSVIAPGVLLLGIFIFHKFVPHKFEPIFSIAIYGLSYLIAFLTSTFLLKRRYSIKKFIEPVYLQSKWLKSSIPLMLLTVMQILSVRVDLLMLGVISGAQSVGVYVVVSRFSQQMYMVSAVIGGVLLPSIAELYSEGEMIRLQKLITKSSRVAVAASSVLALSLFLFSDYLLLLFGSDFQRGRLTLEILVIGQIVNISMGAVGAILTMTSNEKYLVLSVGMSTILNVFLNFILIPKIDIEGAAIATTSSLVLWNLVSYYFVKKKTGIESSFIGSALTR